MNKLSQKLTDYYTEYYHDQLGLKDYLDRVKDRVGEDQKESRFSALKYINKIEKLINFRFDNKKKILVVGAGTGVEMIQFHRLGCKVTGIEPDQKAVEILRLKADREKISQDKIVKAVAEKLPFGNNSFDFIYCFTVLEHVLDVEKSIKEMIRVTKKNGYIFIACPDYRYPWEEHYKMFLPLFLPRIINKLFLAIKGRKTGFFNSLQKISAPNLKKIFRQNQVSAMQIINFEAQKLMTDSRTTKINQIFQGKLGIEPHQFWLIKV